MTFEHHLLRKVCFLRPDFPQGTDYDGPNRAMSPHRTTISARQIMSVLQAINCLPQNTTMWVSRAASRRTGADPVPPMSLKGAQDRVTRWMTAPRMRPRTPLASALRRNLAKRGAPNDYE